MRVILLLLALTACGPSVAGKFSGTMSGEEGCDGSTVMRSMPATINLEFFGKTFFELDLTARPFGVDATCEGVSSELVGYHADLPRGQPCAAGTISLFAGTIDFLEGGAATRLVFTQGLAGSECTGTYTGFLTR